MKRPNLDVYEHTSNRLGYLLRVEGRHAARTWLRARRPRPLDHRAALPVHAERPRPEHSGSGRHHRHPWNGVGLVRHLQRPPLGCDRPPQGAHSRRLSLLRAVWRLRPGHWIRQPLHHPAADGRDGGLVLSNELHRNRRGIASEPAWVPAGAAAVRLRAVRARAWSDHRDAAAAGRSVVAMGVPHRCDSRSHRRQPAVCRPARAGRDAGRPHRRRGGAGRPVV